MEERELIEMTKAYRHRLDSLYPPRPQIQSAFLWAGTATKLHS